MMHKIIEKIIPFVIALAEISHISNTYTAFKICNLLAIENEVPLFEISIDFASLIKVSFLDSLLHL